MDRTMRRGRDRATTGLALLLSVAAHAALFAWVRLDVDAAAEPPPERTAAPRAAPRAWVERPLEVVRVQPTAGEGAEAPARSPDPAPGAVALRHRAADPAGASGTLSAALPLRPAPAQTARGLDLTPVAAGPTGGAALGEDAAAGEITRAGARRGVILRDPSGGGTARGAWDFTAASEAAREAEKRRGGRESGDEGIGGIIGGGGRCPTPGGALPFFGPRDGPGEAPRRPGPGSGP